LNNLKKNSYFFSQINLNDDFWSFPTEEEEEIKKHIEKESNQIKSLKNNLIQSGIKTGSLAFFIDRDLEDIIIILNSELTKFLFKFMGITLNMGKRVIGNFPIKEIHGTNKKVLVYYMQFIQCNQELNTKYANFFKTILNNIVYEQFFKQEDKYFLSELIFDTLLPLNYLKWSKMRIKSNFENNQEIEKIKIEIIKTISKSLKVLEENTRFSELMSTIEKLDFVVRIKKKLKT
jgi:hypothetical protein